MSRRCLIMDSRGKYLLRLANDSASWTPFRARATQFDLDKMDKAAVEHFEKCLGCTIVLEPLGKEQP